MHLGIDLFWHGLPQSQLDLQQARPEYFTWDVVVEADGLQWFSLTPGPLLDKAMHARYLAIRIYLEDGINVIADDLIWKRDWLVDFLRIFEGYEVWLVGIHVSDEEGARREAERYNGIAWDQPRQRPGRPCRCRVRLRAGQHRHPCPGAGARAPREVPDLSPPRGVRPAPQALSFLSSDPQAAHWVSKLVRRKSAFGPAGGRSGPRRLQHTAQNPRYAGISNSASDQNGCCAGQLTLRRAREGELPASRRCSESSGLPAPRIPAALSEIGPYPESGEPWSTSTYPLCFVPSATARLCNTRSPG